MLLVAQIVFAHPRLGQQLVVQRPSLWRKRYAALLDFPNRAVWVPLSSPANSTGSSSALKLV
ncbi:Uncharacterised protein [Kluyvera cryocrescens]|uniref:Uncharacterized protein n=1 Tax=Kluyvera cryocrescens TaxID=580 RepID=A0A485CPX0_KLUCR|nr:Uncharacterised protein [Kluyvera cryocrescens]